MSMIPKKIEEAFSEQIKHELESAYIYLSMAAYFDADGFPGMGTWMRAQVQEEQTHAMRFYKHIVERGGHVKLHSLAMPPQDWKSPLAAFEAAYEHEQFITAKIDGLVKLAQADGDHGSTTLLQWFVDEQIEEEANSSKIVQELRLVGNDGRGILMIDRELGQRTFALAPDLAPLYAMGAAGA
jgi:ferritin